MKIAAFVRNATITPSAYYRIIQYVEEIEKMKEHEVVLCEVSMPSIYKKRLKAKKKAYLLFLSILDFVTSYIRLVYFLLKKGLSSDVIIVSKTFIPKYNIAHINFLLKKFKGKLIWDFDDNILYGKEISPKHFSTLSDESQIIVVTNEYLKELISPHHQHKIILLPTTDKYFSCSYPNTDYLIPMFDNEIRLVWLGSFTNKKYIMNILKDLDEVSRELKKTCGKKVVLTIISNFTIEQANWAFLVRNVQWKRSTAMDEMSKHHFGLMPLENNDYTKGKGSFKIIQYMSANVPILASNVGFNKEVINKSGILLEDNEWVEKLEDVFTNKDLYIGYRNNARKEWEENFSFQYNLKVWKEIIL